MHINILHLLWISPLSGMVGYITAILMVGIKKAENMND